MPHPFRPASPLARRPVAPARPPAFTLIELLIVIGILGILASILFVAFRGVSGSSRESATRVTLGNLAGMSAEYETSARSMKRVNDLYAALGASTDFPDEENDEIIAPGLVAADAYNPSGLPDRYRSAAVVLTQDAMGLIAAVPAARSMLAALPASAFLDPPPDAAAAAVTAATVGKLTATDSNNDAAYTPGEPLSPSVLTDAWGGPILYVPPGGLTGVQFQGKIGNHRIQSNGITPPPGTTTKTNARPFFASAGPDGIFGFDLGEDGMAYTADDIIGGDDNVYSFEN